MKPYKNQDPIRLVVADVDGTLVTQEKVLTAKTKEAYLKAEFTQPEWTAAFAQEIGRASCRERV